MMEKLGLSLFLVALLSSGLNAVEFSDCGSVTGTWSKIVVTGCNKPDLDFCPFKKNTNVTLEVTFTPKTNVPSVTPKVHGIINGLPVPFPLPNENACVNSGLKCPLQPGSSNTYVVSMLIRNIYPKMKLNVKLELQDDKSKDMACVIIPAKIM